MFNTQKTTGSGRLRKLRTGALVSTLALTTFGLGTAVSADEVSTPTPTEQTQTQAQPQATQEAQPVTQQMVDDAQVVAQEAGRSMVVAQADLDQAQATVNAIQEARSEVSSVTEQDVAQAQTEVEQNQQSFAQAQADSARASEAVQNTEKALEAARTNEAQAQANASTAKTAQDQAQTRVDNLSNGSSLADLQEEVQNLQNQVQADQEQVAQAKAALEAARQANQDTEALEKALANAEARVESTAAAYQSALEQVNASQVDLTKAKTALDASATRTEKVQVGTETITTGGKATLNKGVATSSVFKTNGVITTDTYLQALKNLANGTGTADEVAAAIQKGYRGNNLATIAAPGRPGLDSWRDMVGMSVQVDGEDKVVYASDLTDEQLKDMALFYTALVNDLRSKVGTAPLEVTEESLAHTKELVTNTFAKRYPYFAGMTTEERIAENFYKNPRLAESAHTLTALEQTVSPEDSVTTLHFYSDLASIDNPRLSLSEYKLRLMALLGEQLYKPSLHTNGTVGKNYEWAMRLLGLDNSNVKSVGVGFDYFSTSSGWIDPAAEALVNFSTHSGTPIANPYQTLTGGTTQEVPIYEERPVAADPALQAAYNNALQAATQAQAEAENAKLQADQALEDYKTLKDAEKGIVDIPALEGSLALAQAKLQADQDALAKAQADLASISKNETDRAEALKQAQADLLAAQAKYTQALQNLEEAKDQLQRVESANEVAMTAFAKAQSDIVASEKALASSQANHKTLAEQLQNKGTLLADLDKQLAEANQALAQAKQKFEVAQATYSEANTYYLTLLAALQAAKADQDKAQDLANQAKDIQDKGGVVVPVVDQAGNVQGVVDGSNFPTDARVGDIVEVEGTKYRLNADGSVSVVTESKGTNGSNGNVGTNGNVANMGTNQGNGQGTPVAVAYKAASNFDRKDGAKVLPNTGSQDSSAMALGMVGLMATLALVKSRRRKN
ncbi:SEC10/PgrA surface exclusion domain-containing protein [Streptococcus sp. 121]|uniref:LPXTG cell wall anchor domain-containing protein n=1 Tax=Streptococcus sp. 121 TaxID=2797637 RepID=UPI0018F10011|nr:SEC10/PgrA surface exclusion domain-containing protein [Streptococcus sp. 121]MBJ6746164.1 SEC10/PgrA surface exclusion domain-containing protein [Streptococcus sp. 121]